MENKTYIVVVSWLQDTSSIIDVLSILGESMLLLDNTFLVNSALRSSDIRDILKQRLPEDAKIYVSKLSRGSAWSNVEASNMSIKEFYNDGQE